VNPMPFPRRFPWLPALAIVAFSGALLLCNWMVWTPVQRHYLGTYLKCALFGTDPALRTEVQWLYKTAPRGKQELALDADVVPASSGSDRRIPMQLSPAARQAGWAGLLQGPDEWLQTARLQPFLEAQFYAGESFWRLLLTPLLCGTAMLFFLLAGQSVLQSWLEHKQRDMEMIEWCGPSLRLLQRWRAKMGRVRFRLPAFWKHRRSQIAPKPTPPEPATASAEPLKKPLQAALPIFGAPTGKPKERYAWEETKGIE